jgi:hypothetical protein
MINMREKKWTCERSPRVQNFKNWRIFGGAVSELRAHDHWDKKKAAQSQARTTHEAKKDSPGKRRVEDPKMREMGRRKLEERER